MSTQTLAAEPGLSSLSRRWLVLPVLCLLACPAPEPTPEEPLPDLSVSRDLTPPPPPPDLLTRCELPYDLRDINLVSTGSVTIMPTPADPNVFTAEIDATAGGSMKYSENPFVYIDLIGRKKVDITDVQAGTHAGWDLALKRWQIKINSGDSGPSGVTVARVAGKTLPEVSMAPTGTYEADSYFDAKCKLQTDPIGGIATALSDWYEYDTGTSRLVPQKEVLVLKRRDGQGHIKVQIMSYYKGSTSGIFVLNWSYLP
jgi:hypothetical protein